MKPIIVAALFSLVLFAGIPDVAGQGRSEVIKVEKRVDDGGWLGVSIQDMTPSLARSMEVETTEGALVNDVSDGSPAEKAGIRDEDIIIEFDGHGIGDAGDLVERVRDRKPDDEVSLVLMRGGERISLTVTLAETRHPRAFAIGPKPPMHPRVHIFMNSSALGMEVQDLGEQLSDYFGAPDNEGVLVTEVGKESAAEKAGLRAGDVILKIGSQTIRESDDIWDEIEEYKKGDKVDLEILRDRSRRTLTVEIEETPGVHWFRGPRSNFNFDFDFDHDFDRDLDIHEFRNDQRWDREELDRLRIRLKGFGEKIREWGEYIREQVEQFVEADA